MIERGAILNQKIWGRTSRVELEWSRAYWIGHVTIIMKCYDLLRYSALSIILLITYSLLLMWLIYVAYNINVTHTH